MSKTWKISDINGRNERVVTLEQFKEELRIAKERNAPISAAWKRGDLAEVERLQNQLRSLR